MKRVFLIATLALASAVAACGNQAQSVSRGPIAPLGFEAFKPDHNGATSTRSSFDLLSLT